MPMAARASIMARHHALARDLCAVAKEAGLRAACEQTAVELRPPEGERQVEEAEEDGGERECEDPSDGKEIGENEVEYADDRGADGDAPEARARARSHASEGLGSGELASLE